MQYGIILGINTIPEEMRMKELFFCPSCMAKLTPEDGKCPICGSELNIENAPHRREVVS